MNKYTAMALSTVAHVHGRRIIVLSGSQTESQIAFDHFEPLTGTPHIAKVYRANGMQRVEFVDGGRIDFASVRSNMRGWSADVVFVDNDAHRRSLTDEAMIELFNDLRMVVATSPVGEVIQS